MVNICNWLYEAGQEVELVLIAGHGQELLELLHPGIKIHVLHRQGRFDFQAARHLAGLLKSAGAAHIHMRHNYRYTALVAKLFGIRTPLVFHDHYGKIDLDQSIPAGFRSFARPEWYVGVSQTLVSWAAKRLKVSEDRIFLLENAVEAAPVFHHSEKRDLVLVSNIKPQKNQLFALELLHGDNWTLDLYGGRQDEIYAAALETGILRQGVSERIRMFHHCHDVQPKLSAYRLGLHTSSSETGPLAIIEYLSQGLPFIAYRTGEAAEKIGREFPEFFIENFEPEAWTDRIRLLLATPPDLDKMKRVFETYFSKQAYLDKCLNIYRRVLHS